MLGNSSYPLCIGLAVLKQLRTQLMEAQFNECILLFSDMPAVDIDNVVSSSMEIFNTTPASLTWRQHECRRDQPGPLDMTALTIAILKMEKVGRISGAELLQALEDSEAVCVDIRSQEEYKVGTLSKAVNIPLETAFSETGSLVSSSDVLNEAKKTGQIIAVMGSSKNNQAQTFAEKLLICQYPRILTLHGGAEVFYGSGALMVPHA